MTGSKKNAAGKREAGFTLLELCLVVAIILMMLSLALPSMQGLFQQRDVQNKVEAFEKLVRDAGALATKTGLEVRLRWEEDGIRAVVDPSSVQVDPSLNPGAAGAGAFFQNSVSAVQPVPNGGVPGDATVPDVPFLPYEKDELYSLVRLAAWDKQASLEWSFWPSGVREPVEVYFEGPAGRWGLRFPALIPDSESLYTEAW